MGAIRLLSQTASLSNTYPFHCIRIERGRSYRSGFNRFNRTKEREGTKNERERVMKEEELEEGSFKEFPILSFSVSPPPSTLRLCAREAEG